MTTRRRGSADVGASGNTILWAVGIGSTVIGLCLIVGIIGGVWVWRAGGGNVPQPRPTPAPTIGIPVGEGKEDVSAFFNSLAQVCQYTGGIKTTGQFRDTYRLAVSTFKSTGKIPDLSGVDPLISDRIAQAIGLDDKALTPAMRTTLVATLRSIATEVR